MMKVTLFIAFAALSSPAVAQDWLAAAPSPQLAVVAALKGGAEAFANAPNDLQRGAARPARAAAICKAIKNRRADKWIGKLKTLSTNSDGWGVLVVSVTPQASVGTMPNSMADIKDKTLINPKSPVYAAASKLKEGDIVQFSGVFSKGDADCIGEKSLTMTGAMMRPEFVLRFSAISKHEPVPAKPAT